MGNLTYPVAGKYVKLNDGVYYVDTVTGSGAHLIPLSGRPGTIRTSKWSGKPVQEVEVFRHRRRYLVISRQALVEEVAPETLDQRIISRRIAMAKIEGNAETQTETAQETPAASSKVRATQKYKLTDKAPKETMRGQGKLVYDVLRDMGGEANVGELTEGVRATNQLQTRQDVERVVGFYLSKFKREGIVSSVRPDVAEQQAAAAAV